MESKLQSDSAESTVPRYGTKTILANPKMNAMLQEEQPDNTRQTGYLENKSRSSSIRNGTSTSAESVRYILAAKALRQSSYAKDMQSLNIIGKRKMKRLQCRSFPLGAHIHIDGEDTGQVTPWTFNELEAGEHTVEMDYAGKKLSETVTMLPNKRVVCKLYFEKPKTLG